MRRNPIKVMSRWIGMVGLLAVLAGPLSAQPSPIYINLGTVSQAPQIDATAFYNAGTFNIGGFSLSSLGLVIPGAVTAPGSGFAFSLGSSYPFAAQNTLNWTNENSGFLGSSGGFLFDYATPTARFPSANFVNRGTVGAGNLIIANATNIFSSGFLLAGRDGLISLKGDNINLRRSGLAVSEFTPQFSFSPASGGFGTNFFHTQGVQDVYWGVGTNGFIDPQGRVRALTLASLGSPPSSGPHDVINISGFTNTMVLPFDGEDYLPFVYTNAPSDTNAIIQIVYVPTNHTDTNFATSVKFISQPGQDFVNPIVEFTLRDIDVVTGDPVTNFVYFLDFMPTLPITNLFLQNNQLTGTQKPSNYRIERSTPLEWLLATDPNTQFASELVAHPNAVSTDITNYTYTAYSATVDEIDTGSFGFFNPVARALFDPTNQTGRVEIEAKSLDLSRARIRAAGLVTLKANELVGSAPANLDASLVSMELKSIASDTITIDGILENTVRRLSGQLWAWSIGFTNQLVFEEPDPDNPDATTSNTVDVVYNVMILQRDFETQVPVQVRDLDLKSKKVQLTDNFRIGRRLLIDSEEIKIDGQFSAPSGYLAATNFPSVKSLENNGSMAITQALILGPDRTNTIDSIKNTGGMFANQTRFRSTLFENNGTIEARTGVASIESSDMIFDGGILEAEGNIQLKSKTLFLSGSTISAGTNSLASMVIDVSDQMTDGGAAAPNMVFVSDGIALPRLPATSDLLSTTIRSEANRFREVVHVWPAIDKGGTPDAYVNNLAVGVLSLKPELFTLHRFTGTGAKNALYVDFLEWDSEKASNRLMIEEMLDSIEIDDGFTIYFADSNVTPVSIINAFPNKMVWVSDFVGPNSGSEVVTPNGAVVRVNRALANSGTIDTDGDGVANRYDPDPFGIGQAKLEITSGLDKASSVISWFATPGATYRLEATDSLGSGVWSTIEKVSHLDSTLRKLSVEAPSSGEGSFRFYRIVTE